MLLPAVLSCVLSLAVSQPCSEEYTCSMQGDLLLQTIPGVDNEESCRSLCEVRGDCGFYTWYDTSSSSLARFCFLFSSCEGQEPCSSCHSGPPSCPTTASPSPPPSPAPEDCRGLQDSPPAHGQLDCYTEEGGAFCHLWCLPGYSTTGPSVVACSKSLASQLACEPSLVLVTGGDKAMEYVEVYSSSTNSCRVSLPSLPGLFADHTVSYMDGQVLLCGGSSSGHDSCLALGQEGAWQAHSNLTVDRAFHSAGVYRTSLSLLGGRQPSTESWHPGTSSWQPSSPLPEGVPLDGCSAAISSSTLLVTGGHLCPQCTFLYSLATQEWQRLEDMGEGRTSHGCTAYTDPENGEVRVLVAGGWAGHDVRTAEVYNPLSGRWREVGDLTGPRRGLRLATSQGGRVLALGGRHVTAEDSVDEYDTLLESWKAAPALLHQRAYHAVTTVPKSRFHCDKWTQGHVSD